MDWMRLAGSTMFAGLFFASGCWLSGSGEQGRHDDPDGSGTSDDASDTHGGNETDTWPLESDSRIDPTDFDTMTFYFQDTSDTATDTHTDSSSGTNSQTDAQTDSESLSSTSSTPETDSHTSSTTSDTSSEIETETSSSTSSQSESQTQTTSDSDSLDTGEPSDSESLDTGEPSDSEPVDTGEPSDSEPVDTGEPSDSGSVGTETPSDSASATSSSTTTSDTEPSETDSATAPDTDPCSLNTHDCAPQARCLPLVEGYECRCNDGYTGDGRTCTDVDECAEQPGPCTQDAFCDNSEGSYECRCDMGYTPDGIGGCLAEPGTCAINPFGYCLRIEVQSAKILERHVLSGARGTLSAVVYARAGVSDIATVTVDLSDFGGATETPLSLAEGIDAHTARYELSISTSGLESGLHGLEVSATSTSGQTHLGMAYLVVYSGSIRHVGAASLPTIQAAIDAATSGDLVLVPEGVFTGPGNTELHLDGKEIVLDSVSGPQSTFIDLQGTGSGFQLVNSRETERTVISGLTIVRANTSAVRLVTTGPDVSVTPTLFDLHLQSNTSMDEGGALRVAGNGAGARIVSVIFDGNGWLSQTGEGGALYVGKDAYAYVEDSVFTGNQAGYGGAISGDPGSYFEVYRSEFRANQSGQKGGAIYGDWAMLGQCFFDDNTAAFEGGAVYIYSMAHFEGCSFDGNASAGLTSAGGAIYGRGSLTVEGSGLRRNDAKHNAGAIYAGGSLAVSGSVLLYNTATDSGGAIMLRKGGDISLSIFHANAVTTSNTSYGNGGALYIDAQALSPARVSQSTFTSNSSTRSGGAIRGTWVTVEESTFRNNSASAYGGALYFWSGDNVVRGTRIEKNHATLHGGGIYVSSSSAPTLLVEDSEVIENTADGSGGGINAYRTESLTVLGSLFQNNEAGYRSNGYGGALRCYEVTTFCRIESSILRGNRANYGGALRTNDTRLELWNVLVDHNTSRTSGGGLHINNLNGAKAIIESSTFSHNGSLVRGGGVYLYNGVLDLRDSIVFDNTAGQNAASAELYVSKTPAANVATVSYCDIHKDGISDLGRHINDGNGFFPGQEGNLSIDPQFADPDAWDFSLLASSPCLDVGSQDASEALLDGLSARADGLLDDGLLDLGYHR